MINIRQLIKKVATLWSLTVGFALLSCTPFCLSQTVKDIFAFSSSYSSPAPGLVTPTQGRDGNLYGTTTGFGKVFSDGSVFVATTSGKERTLHTFVGSDGQDPPTGLTLGTDGNFYGVAESGGKLGLGLLFKISRSGEYTILQEFTGGADGAFSGAQPVQGWDGNLYGSTGAGTNNGGTIYSFSPLGVFSTIFSFNIDNSQGAAISAPLLQGADGNLYGVANQGGAHNCGTIFKISRAGVLLFDYSFPCGAGGYAPVAPLIQASDGNFYGTTELGGTGTECGFSTGCGTAFRMDKNGSVTILHNFVGSKDDGALPGGLAEGTDRNLYGTTASGGISKAGTLFQLTKAGDFKLLFSFDGPNGQAPGGTLLQDTSGKFYGTTQRGGTYGEGVLYSLDMGLGPFVTFVLPAGRIGQPAQILGQGLTGATSVTFNGVPAKSITVRSDTFMTAIVPTGAATGPVVVTTPTEKLTSNVSFHVLK